MDAGPHEYVPAWQRTVLGLAHVGGVPEQEAGVGTQLQEPGVFKVIAGTHTGLLLPVHVGGAPAQQPPTGPEAMHAYAEPMHW